MDYETLYQELSSKEKDVKDRLAALQRVFKTVCSETETGDIKALTRDLTTMGELISVLSSAAAQLKESVSGFDTAGYFQSGEIAEQIISICEDSQVDIQGGFPVYEIFPYRVKFDVENQDIYLDRKKLSCMRPKSFVETVKKGQERLNRAPFNAQTFLGELADAYDLALLKANKQPGYDIYLSTLYKLLAPMGRYRRDYDQQSYAFDLARLYSSNIQETKSGRRFQFGPSRKSGKSIRVLDHNGQERYLSTICFYEKEE